MPSVSIVIPCFNVEEFIAEALASLQGQTLQDWECLAVDDGSTDGSVAIVEAFARGDPRIRPIRLSVNGGAPVARNAAFEAATGRWITLLDADDIYLPDRLERLVALAEAQSADMVFDDQIVTDYPSTDPIERAFHWLHGQALPFDKERFFILSAKTGRSLNPGYMKPLFKRSFIERHHLRYDTRFRSGQDYLFYASVFAHGPRCFATDHAGYIYRRRKGSLSQAGGHHLRAHAQLSDEILAQQGPRLSREAQGALARRRLHMLRLADLYDLRIAISARRPTAALQILLAHPGIILPIATKLQRRLSSLLFSR